MFVYMLALFGFHCIFIMGCFYYCWGFNLCGRLLRVAQLSHGGGQVG